MKSTLPTLIRSVLKIGSGYLIGKGLIDESQADTIIAAAIAFGAVVWGVLAKKPQADKITKPTIPLMCLIGALSVSGCGSTPEERFESAVDIVQTAAFNGTIIALHEHPEWKPFFTQATQDLSLLANQDNPSMAAIVSIWSRLPVKELSSVAGQLIIGNGTLILQRYERKIDLSRENKLELISALVAGVTAANR